MASSDGKLGKSWRSSIVLVAVGAAGLAVVGCLCFAHWRISNSPGFPHSSSWEVGPVDMTSTEPQMLSFVYTPGVNVPYGLFSIEFRGLPLDSPDWVAPVCDVVVLLKDGERILCALHLETEWCNWHKPHAGLLCAPQSDDSVPIDNLVRGKTYQLVFTITSPVEVPDNVKTVLHGNFVWRGTPTQLVR